jgi:hypothetical protein
MNNDDGEKIKEMWAYNLPCVLLVNQKQNYWPKIKQIYQEIYTDISIKVKLSLASSLYEVSKIHLDELFIVQVVTFFVQIDIEEIR